MNKAFFIILFFVAQSFTGISQVVSKDNTLITRAYNIPPRHVMNKKNFFKIDYSDRLDNLKRKFPRTKNFISEFTTEQMRVLKNNYPKDYSYYMEALAYFDSLSNKIKRAFSKEELWYIYQFDQKLKARLLIIK